MKIYLNLPNRVAMETYDGTWIHTGNIFWIEYPDESKNHTIIKPMGSTPVDYHGIREINIVAGHEITK